MAVINFHKLSPTAYISPVCPGPRRTDISKAQQSCKLPAQGPLAWGMQTVLWGIYTCLQRIVPKFTAAYTPQDYTLKAYSANTNICLGVYKALSQAWIDQYCPAQCYLQLSASIEILSH